MTHYTLLLNYTESNIMWYDCVICSEKENNILTLNTSLHSNHSEVDSGKQSILLHCDRTFPHEQWVTLQRI